MSTRLGLQASRVRALSIEGIADAECGILKVMGKLVVDLPPSVSEQEAKILLTLELYRQGHISLGKAAEMAGYPLREFMRLASDRGIAVIDYDSDDLPQEMLG